MYTTSTTVSSRIESYCRTWRMWLENDESVIMGDNIMSATSDVQSTSLSDDIELGAVCSQSWALQINDAETRFLGKEYDLSLYLADLTGVTTYSTLEAYTYAELSKLTVEQISKLGEVLDGERIPLGRFTCVKSKKSGGSVQLTMADRLYFSDKPYVPHIPMPNWNRSVEDDICRQLGLQNGNDYTEVRLLRDKNGRRLIDKNGKVLYSKYFYFKVGSLPKDVTMRQMLSYLASAQGQFGYVDRYGKYVRKWYGKPVKTLDPNTIDLPTLSERQNVIVGIICKVSNDVTLSWGVTDTTQGRVLEFENPYMTESLLQSLWRRIGGFSWYTTELYHRLGDPRFDIGDVVTYTNGTDNYDIPITNLGFTFDGGLSADISAVGLSVEEQL